MSSQELPKTRRLFLRIESKAHATHSVRMSLCLTILLLTRLHAQQLDRKGEELFQKGHYEEAARHQKRALGIWQDLAPTSPVELAPPHANLAQTYLAQGRFADAEAQAFEARKFSTARTRNRIAMIFVQIHFFNARYSEAEAELRPLLPSLSGMALANARNDLGMIRAALGDLAEARSLIENSLKTGSESGYVRGRVVANLALICFRQNDLSAAISNYQQAIPLLEPATGARRGDLGMVLLEYSQALKKSGNKSEARIAEQKAKTIFASPASAHTIDVRNLP